MKVINICAGPNASKSSLAGYLLYKMKRNGYMVEYLPEYVKKFILLKQYEKLNNQYAISQKQYELMKAYNDSHQVDYLILDTSLISQIYYNENNVNNVCDINKTKAQIIKWYNEFENVCIFIDRCGIRFQQIGRQQDEQTSKQIDIYLLNLLKVLNIDYKKVTVDDVNKDETCIDDLIHYIVNYKSTIKK